MNDFLKFICDHCHVIIESVLTLIVLFVTLFRKKVKINDVFTSVLLVLPDLINEAEASGLTGSEKYSFVFNRCVSLLTSIAHSDSKSIITKYTAEINAAIENILSTPQKKER